MLHVYMMLVEEKSDTSMNACQHHLKESVRIAMEAGFVFVLEEQLPMIKTSTLQQLMEHAHVYRALTDACSEQPSQQHHEFEFEIYCQHQQTCSRCQESIS